MTEVKSSSWSVTHDASSSTLTFSGVIRYAKLAVTDIQAILEMLNQALTPQSKSVTLHLTALSYLDEAGLDVLRKFVVKTRRRGDLAVTVRASRKQSWQGRHLPDLKRFNSNLELQLID
jgi:hypothetical protein